MKTQQYCLCVFVSAYACDTPLHLMMTNSFFIALYPLCHLLWLLFFCIPVVPHSMVKYNLSHTYAHAHTQQEACCLRHIFHFTITSLLLLATCHPPKKNQNRNTSLS